MHTKADILITAISFRKLLPGGCYYGKVEMYGLRLCS